MSQGVRLAYLHGLQYGSQDAFVGVIKIETPHVAGSAEDSLNPSWSTFMMPTTDWEEHFNAINESCHDSDELISTAVVKTVAAVRAGKQDRIKVEEHTQDLVKYQCSDFKQATEQRFFYIGYDNGLITFLETYRKLLERLPSDAGVEQVKVEVSSVISFIPNTPAGVGLTRKFCDQQRYGRVPLSIATKVAVLQARGLPYFQLLEPTLCSNLPTLWANGSEAHARQCSGLMLVAQTSRAWEKPVGFMVAVVNNTDHLVEVNWKDFRLGDDDDIAQAADPERVVAKLERKARLKGAFAGFAASLAASSPQTATIYGPDGIHTIQIHPSSAVAQEIASQRSQEASQPDYQKADALSAYALRRSSIAPGQSVTGLVFFEHGTKAQTLSLEIDSQDIRLPLQ